MRSDVGRAGPGILSEIANETRAKEWQKVHKELRSCINSILDNSSPSHVLRDVSALRRRFEKRADDAKLAEEQSLNSMIETAQRREFVHSLKLSFELIRLKAAAQANAVVVEELNAVLQGAGSTVELPLEEPVEDIEAPSNVIPFKARAGRGR